ncbi:GAF domain-containing sensor histidine kinase [Terrimonas sp. NA20]|uniref:histidine kinase n=1 Tax=Terrimonas ginsenosidimutans TaxID=2908004 RepID=A0ABS9KN60_9BACT|nr:GAF domain-containing sensor histidine kinase [Terrimonas ginsenosidimutans]MCG2613753.1 GAF domain-containing sensor histidine kinase [Terrimonas ginsenosidimutans]
MQLPQSEELRLRTLRSYNILDTLKEKEYDEVTYLAGMICGCPISMISFIDKERQWFKSHRGIDDSETPLDVSFCVHALGSPDKGLIVQDARLDPQFSENPMVTGEAGIVFYAGFPLISEKGVALGSLCVVDRKPQVLSEEQLTALKMLSHQVMQLMESRKKTYEMQVLQDALEKRNKELEQFAMVVASDIRSPLVNIAAAHTMLKESLELGRPVDAQLLGISARAATRINRLVQGILGYYKNEDDLHNKEEIELLPFIKGVQELVASTIKINWIYHFSPEAKIHANQTALEQIFFNLIDNAVRYGDKDITTIDLHFAELEGMYQFKVADNGLGIPRDKVDTIFDLFTTVASKDRFGVKNHGIGLPTVKKLIDVLGGKISVESVVNKGTVFTFTIAK